MYPVVWPTHVCSESDVCRIGRTTALNSELEARADVAKMVLIDIVGIGFEGRYDMNDRTELG